MGVGKQLLLTYLLPDEWDLLPKVLGGGGGGAVRYDIIDNVTDGAVSPRRAAAAASVTGHISPDAGHRLPTGTGEETVTISPAVADFTYTAQTGVVTFTMPASAVTITGVCPASIYTGAALGRAILGTMRLGTE